MANKLRSVIEQTVRQVLVGYMLTVVTFFGFLSLMVVLVANISTSQTIAPLYFRMMNREGYQTVSFLKKIRNLPEFGFMFQMNRAILGEILSRDVFAEDRERDTEIERQNEILLKNPESVTTFYNLFILFEGKGNQKKALEYFNKARAIDPSIE